MHTFNFYLCNIQKQKNFCTTSKDSVGEGPVWEKAHGNGFISWFEWQLNRVVSLTMHQSHTSVSFLLLYVCYTSKTLLTTKLYNKSHEFSETKFVLYASKPFCLFFENCMLIFLADTYVISDLLSASLRYPYIFFKFTEV